MCLQVDLFMSVCLPQSSKNPASLVDICLGYQKVLPVSSDRTELPPSWLRPESAIFPTAGHGPTEPVYGSTRLEYITYGLAEACRVLFLADQSPSGWEAIYVVIVIEMLVHVRQCNEAPAAGCAERGR